MQPADTPPRIDSQTARAAGLARWMPGLHLLLRYDRRWLGPDIVAGLVLTAVLIPVGMGYAEASGVAPIHGLYATIVPLVAYALFGPSRIMVLGPDSTLAAVIAALILPLADGRADRAAALAGALALLTGALQILIGYARLGLVADLFSKPIRLGFLNAIGLTVIVGQLPKLLGFKVQSGELLGRLEAIVAGIAGGHVNPTALMLGAGSLAVMLALRRWAPAWPSVLVAMMGATLISAMLDLNVHHGVAVLGAMPQGLPTLAIPWVSLADLRALLPGAAVIALLSFADTSVLSRSLAARAGERVSQDQEMVALGVANLATGLMRGFPVSSSASRTPVAEAAGSRSQVTGLVGAAAIALLLVFAPTLLTDLPVALLGAVVILACLSFIDVRSMWTLRRQRRVEFGLAVVSFLGVALIGVIEGIVLAIMLSFFVLVWNAWHPYHAVLGRVDGRKGFHDLRRHPQARRVPGLVIFRWDAPLFFANAEIFRQAVLRAVEHEAAPLRQVLVASEAITDVDVTAAEAVQALGEELAAAGIELHFAGLKGPVKDRVERYGMGERLADDRLHPTVGAGVNAYRDRHAVVWKDWDE